MHGVKDFAHPEKVLAQVRIEPGMKIADFGSGSGAYTLPMARALHHTGTVYAIDVQKDLLRRIANEAKHHRLPVDIIWADLEVPHASKLAPHSIDVVLISNLLFQLVDKMPPLREAHRILKARGALVVIDWSESFRHMGPPPEDVVTAVKAREYIERAQFTIETEIAAGAHHYGFVCRPKH